MQNKFGSSGVGQSIFFRWLLLKKKKKRLFLAINRNMSNFVA